jgi:hypothetical protein
MHRSLNIRRNVVVRSLARVGLMLYATLAAVVPIVDAQMHRGSAADVVAVGEPQDHTVASDLPGCALCAAIQSVAGEPPAHTVLPTDVVAFVAIADREHQFVHRTAPSSALSRAPPVA